MIRQTGAAVSLSAGAVPAGALSVVAWAERIFPGVSASESLYRLWCTILSVARADGDDPQGTWETHNATFEKNKWILNSNRFVGLRYASSNGTDLTIDLNEGHVWEGGAARTVDGTVFFPNIPKSRF